MTVLHDVIYNVNAGYVVNLKICHLFPCGTYFDKYTDFNKTHNYIRNTTTSLTIVYR
jgi:hypothetical protein